MKKKTRDRSRNKDPAKDKAHTTSKTKKKPSDNTEAPQTEQSNPNTTNPHQKDNQSPHHTKQDTDQPTQQQTQLSTQEKPSQNIDPKININNHWQTYFDPKYRQNFYYNPFTNESVWTLPEGATVQSSERPVLYVEEPKESQEKEQKESHKAEHDPFAEIGTINESELTEKLKWQKFKEEQLKDWMKRPARQQVKDTRKDTAYIEGNYDYNIWYDKYLTDRKEEKEKIPAMYKCNPARDTGYTRADLQEKGSAYFCLYFAKGCCSEGANCHYYHRVPTLEDAEKIENLRDIFGRSRYSTPLKDYGGVGVFTKECRTLMVSDLKKVETKNPVKDMVRILYENFSPWGEIEDINYIAMKSCCYIRYAHRCFAEFAKEAMMKQSLVGEEIISVKWGFDDPDPVTEKLREKEEENKFILGIKQNNAVLYQSSGYGVERKDQEMIKNCMQLKSILQDIENHKKEEENDN